MTDSMEVQTLEQLSSEVDESKIKVILSTQCIKAQAFLVEKLRKQAERSRDTCNFMSTANSKLQSEITQAQQEINSLLIANETIKMANVELKKELLLAKDKKEDLYERAASGEKKYEALWLECKARYESMPFVQKLLKAREKVVNIEQQLQKLDIDEQSLIKGIYEKKEACLAIDRQRVIELAEYLVNEMPKSTNVIKEKLTAIDELTNELHELEVKATIIVKSNVIVSDSKENEATSNDEDTNSNLIMPKLNLGTMDFDILTDELDQIKIKRVDLFNEICENNEITSSLEKVDSNNVADKANDYISAYFSKPRVPNDENKTTNYAKKKLINILEDIKIDKNDVLNIMANVSSDSFQPVELITVEDKTVKDSTALKNKVKEPLQSDEIEEVDLTSSNADNLLMPPTQFLDITLMIEGSNDEHQEDGTMATTSRDEHNVLQTHQGPKECTTNKKVVSFDLPNTAENEFDKTNKSVEDDPNATIHSQLNISDEGFAKMKDIILKKHNLDLSPQFVYAKNVTALNLQKNDDTIVTSKFFDDKTNANAEQDIAKGTSSEPVVEVENTVEMRTLDPVIIREKNVEMNVENDDAVSSPKRQKTNDMPDSNKPVAGFLLSHGAQSIPDSLDISISTTGYEDGDADFPHCIDSSLLLSPKGDIPMPVGSEHPEVLSQEVPNFLSGLRKTGLSFFGRLSSSDTKPEANAQNQGTSGGFSFNFGGEEKKNRGGLFSMFQ